jgi:transposase Tn5 family protein
MRLVKTVARVALKPAGRVTEVFDEPAEREGTFRLLENEKVAAEEIGAAASRAAARRAAAYDSVWVAIDGTSLGIKDLTGNKGLGLVGPRKAGANGIQVMSALAIAPDGTPLGLCGQSMWTRTEPSTATNPKKDNRPLHEKETRYWFEAMEKTQASFDRYAFKTRPWYLLDRGGDAAAVLVEAVGISDRAWVTVRATHDRKLMDSDGSYLFEHLEKQPPAAFYDLNVPAGPKRTARRANMQLRFTQVGLDLRIAQVGKTPVPIWLVAATEVDTTPKGEEPIRWLLYTTYPVHDAQDAMLVVAGYAQRWRVEQFHNLWKSGACHVEDTQLESVDNIMRWARILASVAVRILRLTYLSRTTPESPATVELRSVEVEAVILLRKPKGVGRKQSPDIGTVVRWLAELGGYTGKSSGGPPGARVIARGLARIESIVEVLVGGEM